MKSKFYSRIIVAFVLSSGVYAQSTDDNNLKSAEEPYTNFIAGHRFIPNSFIQSPFISTYLTTRLGFGETNQLKIPTPIIGGNEIVTLRGDLIYAFLGFDFQFAVKDWMAFYLKIEMINRVGTDVQALVSQGINVNTGFKFGWQLKLYQTDNMLLSGLLRLSNNSYLIIDFYKFAQDIIENGTLRPQNKPVTSTPAMVAATGLSSAYTINKMFGLTACVTAGYGESAERYSGDEWIFDYGVSADADLKPDYSVPVGFTLSYFGIARGKQSATVLGNPQSIFFQINYTGKKDIDLGLVFNYQWFFKESIDQTVNFTSVYLDIKHYF